MRRSTFIVVLLLALASSVNARTSLNLEAFSSLKELHDGGYPVFNTVLGLAIYENRSGLPVDEEMFVKARDASSPGQSAEVNGLIAQAQSGNEFARKDALKELAPWFSEYRRAASTAKGLLIHLPSSMGSYDFDKQSYLMEGVPTGGKPQKNFPGGLICSAPVDKQARYGRDLCLYLSNFNNNGRYYLPLNEQVAHRVNSMWLARNIRIYLVAEFDGPMQESQPRDAAAAVQAVRVVGILVLDGKRNIVAKVSVSQHRLAGLTSAPVLSSSLIAKPPTKAVASTGPSPKVTRAGAPTPKPAPAPVKTSSRPPAHTPGKPIIVDILE